MEYFALITADGGCDSQYYHVSAIHQGSQNPFTSLLPGMLRYYCIDNNKAYPGMKMALDNPHITCLTWADHIILAGLAVVTQVIVIFFFVFTLF